MHLIHQCRSMFKLTDILHHIKITILFIFISNQKPQRSVKVGHKLY